MNISLEGLWMVSDRIVDFWFSVKFHKSGLARILSFWTIMEHVSYPPKKLQINQRFIKTSSRWLVLLWKDYGCFLTELSIFDFPSNFTGPDLQKFSVFELSWSMFVIHHKSYQSSKRCHQYGECHSGRIMDGFWLNCRFLIFRQISQVRNCKNFQFLNYHVAC